MFDPHDEDDLAADNGSGDELASSPVPPTAEHGEFSGYSLPDGAYDSDLTLGKAATLLPLALSTNRITIGSAAAFDATPSHDVGNMSALEELLSEMGYLGEVIVRK